MYFLVYACLLIYAHLYQLFECKSGTVVHNSSTMAEEEHKLVFAFFL